MEKTVSDSGSPGFSGKSNSSATWIDGLVSSGVGIFSNPPVLESGSANP